MRRLAPVVALALATLAGRLVLVLIVTLALLAAPSPARTQAPAAVARIGLIATDPPARTTPRYEAFRQGLRDLGYVEGRNLAIEYRQAGGGWSGCRTSSASSLA